MTGRVALVTGAAGGIGSALVERLRADGWSVHAVDVDDADLTTREGNRAVVDGALAAFGRLDAVVANAGFQHVAPVEEFPEDRWDALLALLLTSPFLLARYAWPALREAEDGRFLAIASVHGLVASPFKAGYVAAKHGLLGLVKTLALEGAEHGITAAALCPAFVRTPLVEAQIAAQAQAHGLPEERVLAEVILERHAVKRLLEPAEVAEVAAFLLSPAGRSVTGAPVVMDLGWTAHQVAGGVESWDWSRRVFDHVDIHASDYAQSMRFYETALGPLGIPKLMEGDDWTAFPNFDVATRQPATQNVHVCFYARSNEQVDAFHRAGVEAGFRSNGAPGYRDYDAGYYAAYLLDPDGNNVEALYRDVGNVGHGVGLSLA